MTSSFAEHHTLLLSSPVIAPSTPAGVSKSLPTQKSELDSLFLSLKPPLTPSQTRNALKALASHDQFIFGTRALNEGEDEVISAIVYKITVGLYAEVLDTYLTEATSVDAEAEWWADIEHSTRNVAWYLLQSMPSLLMVVGPRSNITQLFRSEFETCSTKSYMHSALKVYLFAPLILPHQKFGNSSLLRTLYGHMHSQPPYFLTFVVKSTLPSHCLRLIPSHTL
jgi:hypothetical protein